MDSSITFEPDRTEDAAITLNWVAVPTRSRPGALRRAAASIVDHVDRHGRKPHIVVFDDSRDLTSRDTNSGMLKALSRRYQGRISYFGEQRKASWAASLISESAVDPSIVNFCLYGIPDYQECFGANRNWILLAFANRLALSTDDDVVWCPALPSHCMDPNDVQVEGDLVVRSISSYAPGRIIATDDCLLKQHERVLGRSVGSIVGQTFARRSRLSGFDPCIHLRRSLECGSASVIVSYSGIYGESGTQSVYRAVCFTEDTFALSSRARLKVVASAPTMTISHGGPWMTTLWGFDNRRLLPPFFPLGRNEDAVSGAMIHRCCAHGYFAHLPVSVLHSSTRREPHSWRWIEALPKPRLSDSVLCGLAAFPGHSDVRDTRALLDRLGSHFRAIGGMPSCDLHRLLSRIWRRTVEARLAELEIRMKEKQASGASWLATGEACARSMRAYLQTDCTDDIAATAPTGYSLGKVLRLYGDLLGAWGALTDAARRHEMN